jgi:glycosyltransferase involved in cell wall biosynthesis
MFNYASFALSSISGLVRASKPDCFVVELPPLTLCIPAILFAKLWRVPVILNVSDLWPDSALELGIIKDGLLAGILQGLERWAYQNADYVCGVTQGIVKTLGSQKGVPERKLLFLPNGVDTELLTPQPPDIRLQERLGLVGKNLVVYAGTHSLAHGLDVLLDAAEVMRNEPNFHFVFVGSGSAKKALVARAQRSELPNVSFLDSIELAEVTRLYSIALCGVVSLCDIPILKSARPAKTLSIMACGKPVVLAAKCETSVVEDANAGIVVDNDNPEAIAEAIRRLRNNPELAAQMGRNGRDYVEHHCRWSVLVDDWLLQLRLGGIGQSEFVPAA